MSTATIGRWGKSLAVRLPSEIASRLSLTEGATVDVEQRDDEIVIRKLARPLTLEILARHAAVSPRTFSRRFAEDTGYPPMQWVMLARIDLARELLELSQLSVEQIAARAGLGTGANLRLHFQRILGTTPSQYRRTFVA